MSVPSTTQLLERGTNVRKDDPRSDIYFVENMLYHMIAGEPALTETRDRLQRLNATRFQEVVPLTNESLMFQVLRPISYHDTEFSPEKRIQSAAQLQTK